MAILRYAHKVFCSGGKDNAPGEDGDIADKLNDDHEASWIRLLLKQPQLDMRRAWWRRLLI